MSAILAVRIAHSAPQIRAQSAKKVLLWRATNVLRVTASVKHAKTIKIHALSAQIITKLSTTGMETNSSLLNAWISVVLDISRKIMGAILAVKIALNAIQQTRAQSAKKVLLWRAVNVLCATASVKHAKTRKIPALSAQMVSSLCMTAKQATLFKTVCQNVLMDITSRMVMNVVLAV